MKNKFINKLVLGFCVFIMLTAQLCTISNADVAWEPENNFYRHHADKCHHVREELIANGRGGEVVLWESPVSGREIVSIENGTGVSVEYTFTDKRGYEWGLVINGGKSGWAPMDYLVNEPGLLSFTQKHSDEYQEFDGTFLVPEGVNEIMFWSYPGSGVVDDRWKGVENESVIVDFSYTDSDGRQWGYVNYFRAADGWICMSDPANDQIPVNKEDAAGAIMPAEPTIIITPEPEGINIVVLVAILVVVVGAGTGVLIRVMFKRNAAKSAASATMAASAKASDEHDIK